MKSVVLRALVFLMLLDGVGWVQSAEERKLAPGYKTLPFILPAADSYRLPIIGKAADGEVLTSNGIKTTLYELMAGKTVLLSFIYSACSDTNGCPLATAVLHKINSHLRMQSGLTAHLRLLTLSFDPEHDTPAVMDEYGKAFTSRGEWRFLTTASKRQLLPILQGYDQSIQEIIDSNGSKTGTFSHSLRVYLIDRRQNIRAIYNTEFLHADTVMQDIRSVLAEKTVKSKTFSPVVTSAPLLSLAVFEKPPLGLPAMPVPTANPPTSAKIALGRKLFFDRRLSLNNTFSCAMCHIPAQGFTSNEMATAVGVEGRTVKRNSPTLYNIGYFKFLFHDGREYTLEQQVWGPFLAKNEMANPSVGAVIEKIRQSADYEGLFEQAFGRDAGMETVGMALAGYQRTLVSGNSAFDRWHYGKNAGALTQEVQQGFRLFVGKADCSVCHSIGKDAALFMDNGFHNTGIGFAAAMAVKSNAPKITHRLQIAPGLFTDIPTGIIEIVSEHTENDVGRYEVTQKPEDRWRYKTPSLRNIALTAPYMHNGSIATLREVVEFYNRGGIPNETLDPLLKPLHLSEREVNQLVIFLQALTADNVRDLSVQAMPGK